jgi:TRAP transporter TAXI family solute receptor
MKKVLAFMLALTMLGSLIAGCGGSGKEEKKPAAQKFINIATGGTAGTYFPLGGAIADILNKNIPGANASAQSTGASVANINLLNQGKVDIAFVQNDIAYYPSTALKCSKTKKFPA